MRAPKAAACHRRQSVARKPRVSALDAPACPAVTSEARKPSGGLTRHAAAPGGAKCLLCVEVPCLPDKALCTNSRDGTLHWAQRAARVNDAKDTIRVEARTWRVSIPILQPVEIRWKLYIPNFKYPDWDGIVGALKPWQDALVEVLEMNGDSPKWVRKGSVEYIPWGGIPSTILEIWPYEAKESAS